MGKMQLPDAGETPEPNESRDLHDAVRSIRAIGEQGASPAEGPDESDSAT